MASLKPVSFTSDSSDLYEIQRRQKLAEALQKQAMEPIQPQQGGRYAVPISPWQGLAKIGEGISSSLNASRSQELARALDEKQQQRRSADMSLLVNAMGGRQASPGGLSEDAAGNVTQADALPAQTPQQSLGQAIPMMSDPQIQPLALNAMMGAQQREDTQNFQRSQTQAQQAAHLHERELAIQAQNERARQQQQWQDQQARQAAADRQGLAQMVGGMRQETRPPVAVMGPDGKPIYVRPDQAAGRQPANPKGGGQLPASALKIQNEMLDDIGLAGSIKSDLGALTGQLEGGTLQLGPMENLWSQARNVTGRSSENSRNFASFQSTLEKLRNDSLRLNKGVQTEGDAIRAWNELFKNVNDPKVVKQRLTEIQDINERASGLKKLQIDTMRANFGMDPLDVGQFANQVPAVGHSGQSAYGGPERRAGGTDPLGIRRAR